MSGFRSPVLCFTTVTVLEFAGWIDEPIDPPLDNLQNSRFHSYPKHPVHNPGYGVVYSWEGTMFSLSHVKN